MSGKQERRDRRLQAEFNELMEFSARSPLVKIEPVGVNRPPIEYLVTYECLGYTDNTRKSMATGHRVRISLPSAYPDAPPIFQYESSVWAPRFIANYVASEHGGKAIPRYICIGHIGAPSIPLRTFIVGVGHMIQLRRDADGLKPIDIRSLEGSDASEVRLEPASQAPEIIILPLAEPDQAATFDVHVCLLDENRVDDLSDQIKFSTY